MPCLVGRCDPRVGPIVPVCVVPPGTQGRPSLDALPRFSALIDTGATTTCISPPAAAQAGLRPIGMRPVASATHIVPVNVYLADLVLPFGNFGLEVPGAQLLEFGQAGGAAAFQMLLGRDILCRGVFTLSFDGHFSLSL